MPKGVIPSRNTKRKISEALKGRPVSKATRKKISKSNTGKIMSREARKKMSDAKKGKPTWNKGKTGIYSKKTRKKMGEYNKGKPAWNRGIPLASETKKKLSKSLRGRISPMKGKTHSKKSIKKLKKTINEKYAKGYVSPNIGKKRSSAHKKKLSESGKKKWKSKDYRKHMIAVHLGQKAWNKGKKTPEKTRLLQSKKKLDFFKMFPEEKKRMQKIRLKVKIPTKDSGPEKLMQKLLKTNKIRFKKHLEIVGLPDIFIPPNLLVFVDGDYWHANPKEYKPNHFFKQTKRTAKEIWAKDSKITKLLKSEGYSVLRFWESDLKENPEKCVQKILKKPIGASRKS